MSLIGIIETFQEFQDTMQVRIKNHELNNKGMEFEVRDNSGNFLGDFYVTNTGVTWCKGKTNFENGIEANWPVFIKWMEDAT